MTFPVPKVVAEVSTVHLGSMEKAKMLIDLASRCGADFVKFQKRYPEESTPKHIRDLPHPNPHFAYGATYLEHRKNLELTIEQHSELKTYCETSGIDYATSVWDITSAKEVIQLNPKFIKVPSACNTHWKLLEVLFNEYKGDIHISSGMTTYEERTDLLTFLGKYSERVVFYHCTSKYPCDFDSLYLREIEFLKSFLPTKMRLGFSNHGKGIACDIAAYALGAEWIERHFCSDRAIPHSDAAASLEEPGLTKLVRDLKAVYKATKYRPETMDKEELVQRNKLKYSGEK